MKSPFLGPTVFLLFSHVTSHVLRQHSVSVLREAVEIVSTNKPRHAGCQTHCLNVINLNFAPILFIDGNYIITVPYFCNFVIISFTHKRIRLCKMSVNDLLVEYRPIPILSIHFHLFSDNKCISLPSIILLKSSMLSVSLKIKLLITVHF